MQTQTTARQKRPGPRYPAMAAATAAVVVSGLIGVPPSASAAAPTTAQTWSALIHRSLGPSEEGRRLKALLAVQQSAVDARATDTIRARRQQSITQAQLAAATTADADAQLACATAKTAVAAARKALSGAVHQRPASKARITQARRQLKTATGDRRHRSSAAARAASTLRAAQAGVRTAAQDLAGAAVAWRTANVAVRNTEQKIAALPAHDPALAAQAAAVSRTVVTEIRATFTPADTTQVGGITVNKTIAYALQRLIADAHRDGIELSGGGFRTRQQQIQLRVANGCPDVWTAPASSCKVPTAIPGRSLHEIGLAVDMTSGQKTIKDRTGPAFLWLAAHADEYGFVNLPSEPWHWSITGG